jgi:ribose transport system substrate-binding protein
VTTAADTTNPSADRPAPPERPRPARQPAFSLVSILIIAVLGGLALWYAGVFKGKPRVAIVTSGEGPYWDPVIAGAEEAAKQHGVRLTVVRSKSDKEVQFRNIQDVLNQEPDGLAVSPLDPEFQSAVLADVAARTTLVTFDSDSPVSRRLCFVGTDNYSAGRLCGEAVKRAMPDGGEVVIMLGVANKENTQRRRQGVIDELLDRPDDPLHLADPYDKPVKGERYTVVATIADDGNRDRAAQLAAEAVTKYPGAKCFVGLISYSAPTAAEALKKAGKLGQVKVVGFDVDERTLAAIEAGEIDATVMQDQYGMGYHAVRILAADSYKNRGELPAYQVHTLPCKLVTKENLADARGGARKLMPPSSPATRPASTAPTTNTVTAAAGG